MIPYHRPTAGLTLAFTGGVMLVGFALYFLAITCLAAGVFLCIARVFGISV